jgi:hypothetical protein
MSAPLNVASRNALDACAAWISYAGIKALIAAYNPALGESLQERLQFTSEIQSSILPVRSDSQKTKSEVNLRSEFTLVCIQPLTTNLSFISHILRHPKLRQVLVLQSSWLGCQVLPEWNTLQGRRPARISQVRQILQALNEDQGWSFTEITIGNLSSLFWGFVSGRLTTLKRPELADRCEARTRRHLFPTKALRSLYYLALTRAARE